MVHTYAVPSHEKAQSDLANFKLQTTSGTASAQEVNGAAERTLRAFDRNFDGEYKNGTATGTPLAGASKTEYDNKTPEEKLKILASRKADQLLDTLLTDPRYAKLRENASATQLIEAVSEILSTRIANSKEGHDNGKSKDAVINKKDLKAYIKNYFEQKPVSSDTNLGEKAGYAPQPGDRLSNRPRPGGVVSLPEVNANIERTKEALGKLPELAMLPEDQRNAFINKIASTLSDPSSLTNREELKTFLTNELKAVLKVPTILALDDKFTPMLNALTSRYDNSIDAKITSKLTGKPEENIVALSREWKALTGRDLTEDDIKKFVAAYNAQDGIKADPTKQITAEKMTTALTEFKTTVAELMDPAKKAPILEEAFKTSRALYDQLNAALAKTPPVVSEIEAAAIELLKARHAKTETPPAPPVDPQKQKDEQMQQDAGKLREFLDLNIVGKIRGTDATHAGSLYKEKLNLLTKEDHANLNKMYYLSLVLNKDGTINEAGLAKYNSKYANSPDKLDLKVGPDGKVQLGQGDLSPEKMNEMKAKATAIVAKLGGSIKTPQQADVSPQVGQHELSPNAVTMIKDFFQANKDNLAAAYAEIERRPGTKLTDSDKTMLAKFSDDSFDYNKLTSQEKIRLAQIFGPPAQ